MGQTARLLLEKLVARASTKADLISYWNSNAEILDALVLKLVSASTQVVQAPTDVNQGILGLKSTDGDNVGLVWRLGDSPASSDSRWWQIAANYNAYGRLDILRSSANNTYPTVQVAYFDKDGNFWTVGDCSALTFTDRTPHFTGDALAAIQKIRPAKGGEIDHATLPEFAISPYQDAAGQWWPGRSLGDMVSVLTVAIQQLAANYDAAIAERDEKIEKLSKRIDALAAKLPA